MSVQSYTRRQVAIAAMYGDGHKIPAIKHVRTLTGMGLREAKDLVELACASPDEKIAFTVDLSLSQDEFTEAAHSFLADAKEVMPTDYPSIVISRAVWYQTPPPNDRQHRPDIELPPPPELQGHSYWEIHSTHLHHPYLLVVWHCMKEQP